MATRTPDEIDFHTASRFWEKVDVRGPDDCWEWQAAKAQMRKCIYGVATIAGRAKRAHRVAFRLTNGYWPNVCRHTCDNPSCCNPNHLRDGTQADNVQDSIHRGRARYGSEERHRSAKLSRKMVSEMRAMHATGFYSYAHLGRLYGVTRHTAAVAVKGITWKGVPHAV